MLINPVITLFLFLFFFISCSKEKNETSEKNSLETKKIAGRLPSTTCSGFFEELKNTEGKIKAPKQTCYLDQKLVLKNPLELEGDESSKIIVTDGGGFILDSSKLVFKNISFEWQRNQNYEGNQTLFELKNTNILFEKIRIDSVVSLKQEYNRNPEKLSIEAPPFWIFRSFIENEKTKIFSNLIIKDGYFKNSSYYSVGFLYIDPKNIKNEKVFFTDFLFENNFLQNFHAGVYFSNCENCLVKKNKFYRVSFGNVVFSGTDNKKSVIEENRFIYSGNGTSGDALTLSGIENFVIQKNTILNGSCYGIAIHDHAKEVILSENIIVGGITDGLYIPGSSYTNFHSITLEKNFFSNNRGNAFSLSNIKELNLFKNILVNNGHFVYNSILGKNENNYTGVNYTDYHVLNKAYWGRILSSFKF